MKDIVKSFGDNVRAKRHDLGHSQEDLSLKADIDRSYLGRIERGEVNITIEMLYKLAETLECHPRELLP